MLTPDHDDGGSEGPAEAVADLCRRWVDAEVAADTTALDRLAAEDFTLIGPAGFVLDRAQWLERFGPDRLSIESIDWTTDSVRGSGGWATLIGSQEQKATYAGRRTDGRFRASVSAALTDDGWRLTTIQFSPLGGPPPFAAQSGEPGEPGAPQPRGGAGSSDIAPQALDFLRYTHLDKTHGYLPGMVAAQPAIFGLTDAEFRSATAVFERNVHDAARELLSDLAVGDLIREWVASGPLTVLVAGESITDDLQSWLAILEAALDQHSPGHGITLVNRGLSAHTSAMLLRSWPATVTATRPDAVVCALGGNDSTRIGDGARKTQVSREETLANLEELRRIAQATRPGLGWLWVTPAPVDEERVTAYPAFRFGQSSWRNEDLTDLTEALHGLGGPSVDLISALGAPPTPELVQDDGVHPTLAGQVVIARAILPSLVAVCAEQRARRNAGSGDRR